MRVQHNIMAMNSYRNYNNNTSALSGNLEKLSSGYKINRAGDDAAGLAISEKMRAQITGLDAAQKNVKDGISLVKTAEGAMQEIQDMLGRMKYLATQSANGTYQDEVDRENLQKEVDSLRDEINRIADSANFNGINLLDGSMSAQGPVTSSSSSQTAAIGTAEQALIDAVKQSVSGGTGFTDGNGSAADTQAIDLSTLEFENAGKVTVTMGGQTYDVDVTAGMDGAAFATALAAAYNAGTGVADADSGTFSVADDGNGTLTFTASGNTQNNTSPFTDFNIENAAAEDASGSGSAAAAATYESTIDGDDGTNALTDNDSITINGHTYNVKSTGAGATDIDASTATTFAAQMQAAVDLYNAESGEEFTASYADGKLTFTAQDGVTPTADPTFSITDAAGNLSAGAVTEVEAEDSGSGDTKGPRALQLQIGDTSDSFNQMKVSITDMHVGNMGKMVATKNADGTYNYTLDTGADAPVLSSGQPATIENIDISDQTGAAEAIDVIKGAINYVSSVRGDLGAIQNRLDHTANNLSVMEENIQDAESTIRDTDVADEMMSYVKNNILVQSAQAMLAQANQVPQGVLQLLG